jgi:hypothetical protein
VLDALILCVDSGDGGVTNVSNDNGEEDQEDHRLVAMRYIALFLEAGSRYTNVSFNLSKLHRLSKLMNWVHEREVKKGGHFSSYLMALVQVMTSVESSRRLGEKNASSSTTMVAQQGEEEGGFEEKKEEDCLGESKESMDILPLDGLVASNTSSTTMTPSKARSATAAAAVAIDDNDDDDDGHDDVDIEPVVVRKKVMKCTAPKCPSNNHEMCIANGTEQTGYASWICNGCRGRGTEPRWWCSRCRDDFCFNCKPKGAGVEEYVVIKPPSVPVLQAGGGAGAAASSTTSAGGGGGGGAAAAAVAAAAPTQPAFELPGWFNSFMRAATALQIDDENVLSTSNTKNSTKGLYSRNFAKTMWMQRNVKY